MMMEPTSNLSCFADASSRRAALHSVAAMMSRVGICLGAMAKFNPKARTSFSSSIRALLLRFLTTFSLLVC